MDIDGDRGSDAGDYEHGDDASMDEDEMSDDQPSRKRARAPAAGSRKKPATMADLYGDDVAEEDGDEEVEGGNETLYDKAEVENDRTNSARFAGDYFRKDADAMEIARQVELRQEMEERREREQRALLEASRGQYKRPLPTAGDPKLFKLATKEGSEKLGVLSLMRKARDGRAPGIFSAFTTGSVGLIYVEAMRAAHVTAAVDGMDLFRPHYRNGLVKLPIREMHEAVRPDTTITSVREGRPGIVQQGLYRGDVGLVVRVSGGDRVVMRLVPRVDVPGLSMSAKERAERRRLISRPQRRLVRASDRAGVDRCKSVRPPWGGDNLFRIDRDFFDEEGYLLKQMPAAHVNTRVELSAVQRRQLADLQDADAVGQELEPGAGMPPPDTAAAAGLSASTGEGRAELFVPGEAVQAVRGELEGAAGTVKVLRPREEAVHICITGMGTETFFFLARDLCKVFDQGTHVKVTRGHYEGETGTVVKCERDGSTVIAYVLTDTDRKELRVPTNYMVASEEVAGSLDRVDGYGMGDLVQLGPTTAGVITRVRRNQHVSVLTADGVEERVAVQALQGTLRRRTVVTDSTGQEVGVGARVDVITGPLRGRSGTVRHIFNQKLFVHSRHHAQTGGLFVVERTEIVKSSSEPSGGSGAVLPNARARRAMPSRRADDLVGKVVRVTTGRHRRLRGRVLNVRGETVVVRLDALHKAVSLARSAVEQVNPGDLVSRRASRPTAAGALPGARTPHHSAGIGGATPRNVGTPGHSTPHGGDASVWRADNDDEDEGFQGGYDGSGTPGTGYPAGDGYTPGGHGDDPYGNHSGTPGADAADAYNPGQGYADDGGAGQQGHHAGYDPAAGDPYAMPGTTPATPGDPYAMPGATPGTPGDPYAMPGAAPGTPGDPYAMPGATPATPGDPYAMPAPGPGYDYSTPGTPGDGLVSTPGAQ